MISHPYIDDYLAWADQNPDRVSRDVKLLIQNIVKPLLEDDSVAFDAEIYEKCIKFCEKNYFQLFRYQKFIYAFPFMYREGLPVFSTFFIMMGRGNGKTSGMMPLMNFLQTPLHGIRNYHVDIIANNEDQAKKDFGIVYDMLESDKTRWKKTFAWTKALIKNKATGAELRYNTSNAKTKDGKEGGALLFDEVHAFETYDDINVFSSQLGKIKHPRKFYITTNGYVRDGVLDDLVNLSRTILKTGENELGYFPFICTLDDESEVDNEEAWEKANPSMEYLPVLKKQIKQDYLEMKYIPSKRPEFICKRMNLSGRSEEQAVASWDNIKACTEKDVPELEDVVIGIDFADFRDFASAGILGKVDDKLVWLQHTWICRRSPFFESIKFPFANFGQREFMDFEVVDAPALSVDAVVEWCAEQMRQYQVQKIVMDTYRFSLFRQSFENHWITIESKDNPYGTVRMIRHAGAIDALTAPIIEKAFTEHKIIFGPSAIMRWYTNNTAVKMDGLGNKKFVKIEPKLRKNDGFMAFVMAMSCQSLLDEVIIYV